MRYWLADLNESNHAKTVMMAWHIEPSRVFLEDYMTIEHITHKQVNKCNRSSHYAWVGWWRPLGSSTRATILPDLNLKNMKVHVMHSLQSVNNMGWRHVIWKQFQFYSSFWKQRSWNIIREYRLLPLVDEYQLFSTWRYID